MDDIGLGLFINIETAWAGRVGESLFNFIFAHHLTGTILCLTHHQ